VPDLLEQRLADALRDTAMDLAVDEHSVRTLPASSTDT
jgi:hypothetical protein